MPDSSNTTDRSRQLIVISGAGSGIGLDVTYYLSELGYTVVAGVRSPADVDPLVANAEFKDRVKPLVFDVTSDEQVGAAATAVGGLIADGYSLRGVFSNAGIVAYSGDTSCEKTPISTLARLIDVNYLGAARFIQAFLPMLRASAGTVVINSAMMAHIVLPFSAGYASSKTALEAWADSLRREVAMYGVRVAIIELGGVATNLEVHSAAEPMHSDLYPGEQVIADSMAKLADHTDDPDYSPRRVSELVAQILETERPRARYRAGYGAKMLGTLGSMPMRVQDLAFRMMMSKSKPKSKS